MFLYLGTLSLVHVPRTPQSANTTITPCTTRYLLLRYLEAFRYLELGIYDLESRYLVTASDAASTPFSSASFCSAPFKCDSESFAGCSEVCSVPSTSVFSLLSSSSGRKRASRWFPSSILSNTFSLLFDAIRSVLHSLLALASVACCFSSLVFAISMSKSSSAIGPLNDSALGIWYLWTIERDCYRVAIMVLPFRVFQLLHDVGIAAV